jgi:hypothetical protein
LPFFTKNQVVDNPSKTTTFVNPSLKCPVLSKVEMSLYELNRVGELGFTVRSNEGFWCDENGVYRP